MLGKVMDGESMAETPVISLLTVVRDDAEHLRQTLRSIDVWDARIEVLVKDGLSKDETVEVAKSYLRHGLRVIERADVGIYDAMNQAVALATGRYVLFLNAGERLLPGALERMLQTVTTGADLYKFLVQTENAEVRRERGGHRYFARHMLNHQGLLYRKDRCFTDHVYDPSLRIVGDLRHLLEGRLWRRVVYVDDLVVRYKGDGVAASFSAIRQNWWERLSVWRWHRVGTRMRLIVFSTALAGLAYWWCRYGYRRISGRA